MLDPENHEGIFWFMLGISILVLSSVGLSILADKRFRVSRSKVEMMHAYENGLSDLAHLKEMVDVNSKLLFNDVKHASTTAEELDALNLQLDRMKAAKTALNQRAGNLQKDITNIQDSFSHYRSSYRDYEWRKATGEIIGTLVTSDGQADQEAKISNVSPIGLEILHRDGSARILCSQLPSSFQERFQWDHEESLSALDLEQKNHTNSNTSISHPTEIRKTTEIGNNYSEKVRARCQYWRARVITLRHEHRSAVQMSFRRRNQSVPGSLETWGSRAVRLQKELLIAERQLADLLGRLAKINPSDPLLKQVK